MKRMNRRQFTKVTATGAGMTALGYTRILGANDRLNMGMIGCGDRGTDVWKRFLKEKDMAPVALCDVFEPYLERAHQLSTEAAGGSKIPTFKDFRKLLELKEVDAVLIGTPDHWHAINTILACEAGKDVYCEKPLSLCVADGRKMVTAARKHNRVVQTGSQQRSGPHYQEAVKIIQSGGIGNVHKITVGYTRNGMPGFIPEGILGKGKEVPKGLDWDMWLGPAPMVPYDPFRCLYNFRWFWDYSGGQMTNWGAHNIDIARMALKAKGPTAVAAFGGRYEIKDGGQTPDIQEVLYSFPDCVVSWTGREVNRTRDEYLTFHGTKGTLSIMREGFKILPETWRKKDKPEIEPMEMKGDPNECQRLHIRNFIDCVKTRKRPAADVEEGHLTATMCHLGNIATRLSTSFKWDAESERILGNPEANKMLSRPKRAPWNII